MWETFPIHSELLTEVDQDLRVLELERITRPTGQSHSDAEMAVCRSR